MKQLLPLLLIPFAAIAANTDQQVSYFPSLMYGHILAGTAASRYETTLILKSPKGARAHIEIFSEQGKPMDAGFTDQDGNVAATTSSFAVVLEPGRTLLVKLQLPEEEASNDIAIRTGWATVSSVEELEVSALVRVTTPQGKLVSRYLLSSEKPTRS
jgi:hypothetical protein